MSGYRANVGYGILSRPSEMGPAELPFTEGGTSGTRLPVYLANGTTATDCIHQLTKRFGVGVDISINRTRGINYRQDLGLREFTVATSGMYEVDFTINGAFTTDCADWIQYGIMSEVIKIDKDSTFVDSAGDVISAPADTTAGYVKTGGVASKSPILYAEYNGYKTQIGATAMVIEINYYINLDGPKYFDIGYEQVNENTSYGANKGNEIGVLCGCVIDNFSISYESGGDAAITFSLSGTAMSEWIQTTHDAFDYNGILDPISSSVLIAGCLSVDKTGNGTYTPIAQTDSASITVSNNTTKLGNCLKIYYSSVALGAQTVELSTSTYSNDPNKYLNYMYGYDTLEVKTGVSPQPYSIAKQPRAIPSMEIRSDDTSSEVTTATNFIKIYLTKVFVGSANRTYNVENAIMDEPDLRPRKVKIVVGHTPAST